MPFFRKNKPEEKVNLKETKKLTIAPIDMRLNVDNDFTNFCLKKLQKKEVETGQNITITMLGHAIPFIVKFCIPEHSKVGLHTELEILKVNTRSDMSLNETGINVFMSDVEAKKILSELISKEKITRKNGIAIWNEFKESQKQLE